MSKVLFFLFYWGEEEGERWMGGWVVVCVCVSCSVLYCTRLWCCCASERVSATE